MLKQIRQFHLYAGLFFAPTIIFFAFSGVLQTFGFHEDQKDGASAPFWIAAMAEVHKNQKIMDLPDPASKTAAPDTAAGEPAPNETANSENAKAGVKQERKPAFKKPRHAKSLALQIFVALMSGGLIASVASGIFMSFTYQRKKPVIFGLLIAGTLIPVAALFL